MNKKIIPFANKQQTNEKPKAKLPIPDNKTVCDICHHQFQVSKDTLKEESITLEKDGQTHDVVLTYLYCPNCGKRYPVIMDDETTLPILHELKDALMRRVRFASKGNPIPKKLDEKYKKLNKKLDFRRQQLAEKFNGSFYQTDEGKEQLEYRYHVR